MIWLAELFNWNDVNFLFKTFYRLPKHSQEPSYRVFVKVQLSYSCSGSEIRRYKHFRQYNKFLKGYSQSLQFTAMQCRSLKIAIFLLYLSIHFPLASPHKSIFSSSESSWFGAIFTFQFFYYYTMTLKIFNAKVFIFKFFCLIKCELAVIAS